MLYQHLGKAESESDNALLEIGFTEKLTRREADAITATCQKLQAVSESIMAIAFKKKPPVRIARVNGKMVIRNY